MDTTIRVRLSAKDTSFIIVSQQPILDEEFLRAQESDISKRNRRVFGKDLMKYSLIPFALSLVSGAITYYEISKADDSKKTGTVSNKTGISNKSASGNVKNGAAAANSASGKTNGNKKQ